MLEEYELGAEGVAYIREELEAGSALALLLRSRPLERGQVRAFLPPELSSRARLTFRRSIIMEVEIAVLPQERQLVASLLGRELRQNSHLCAIFDTYLGLHWPEAPKWTFPLFSHGNEIFKYAAMPDADIEGTIVEIMGRVSDYPFIAVLTALPPELADMQIRHAVSDDTLALLASETRLLIVGAYDNEAYLLWRPAHPSADPTTA